MEIDDEVTSSFSSAQRLDRMAIDDCTEQNHIRVTPDFSELTYRNSKEFVSGLQAPGSMSKEWTNEKHSLFLDSMEASFVRRLLNHEYDPVNTLGQHSSIRNLQDHNILLQSDANQFKMLQSGCWKKTNFEFSQRKSNTVDERRVLLDNQWIRHYRYVDKQQEFALPNQHENCAGSGVSVFSRGQKLECFEVDSCGATMCSKKLDVGYSDQRDQDYVIDNSEVSDQNFVDEDNEETHMRNPFKGKKMKKATEDVQIRDDVIC